MNQQPELPTYLSRAEVAQMLGVHTFTIFRYTKQGRLPALRIGKRVVRYRLSDVEKLINSTSEVAA